MLMDLFSVKYKGLRIAPSLSAMRELMQEGKTLIDVIEILENGYDAPRKRAEGTIERWMDKGNKTYNIVITNNYDQFTREEVWVLIHFGKFGRKKK